MSVTNRCKVLTLSGAQCFAVVRALRVRQEFLKHQLEHAGDQDQPLPVLAYLQTQLNETQVLLVEFNATPFSEVQS